MLGLPAASLLAEEAAFDGLDLNLGNLYRVAPAQSRSISPENFTGEKGKAGMATEGTGKNCARELGQGWKISPSVRIKAKTTFTMGEIKGPGCIQQIWMTPTGSFRHSIIRFYWDDELTPSVECPVGDFFACGWGKYCQINSLAICVNPGSAFNCYWPMPFRKKARLTLENTDDKDMTLYYQINYTLTAVPRDAGYFHAQFRRESPLRQKGLYTILDGVEGQGQYVGTYLAWEVHSPGWWGEGEIKFFMDGDKEFPTICGTGTEDYFCGSYNFETPTPDGKKKFFNLKSSVKENRVKPAGEWNTLEVTARGSTLVLWVNGAVTCQFDQCNAPEGRLGVEGEGYRIEFRNLKVKELR